MFSSCKFNVTFGVSGFIYIFSTLHAERLDLGRPFRVIPRRQRFEHWLRRRLLFGVTGGHTEETQSGVILLQEVQKFWLFPKKLFRRVIKTLTQRR